MRKLADELQAEVDRTVPALLALTEEAAERPHLDGGWSKKQVLGHLIDSAANNHQRFVRLQFETNLALPGYRQQEWVAVQRYQTRPWVDLVMLWRAYNLHLSHVIAHMDPGTLGNIWKFSEGDLTLEAIVTDYLRHLRHHLAQIAETQPPASKTPGRR